MRRQIDRRRVNFCFSFLFSAFQLLDVIPNHTLRLHTFYRKCPSLPLQPIEPALLRDSICDVLPHR